MLSTLVNRSLTLNLDLQVPSGVLGKGAGEATNTEAGEVGETGGWEGQLPRESVSSGTLTHVLPLPPLLLKTLVHKVAQVSLTGTG